MEVSRGTLRGWSAEAHDPSDQTSEPDDREHFLYELKGALRVPAPLRALASLASSRRPEGVDQRLEDQLKRADPATRPLHVNGEHRGGRGRAARYPRLTSGAEALSAVANDSYGRGSVLACQDATPARSFGGPHPSDAMRSVKVR
jgi:hypothetical protein